MAISSSRVVYFGIITIITALLLAPPPVRGQQWSDPGPGEIIKQAMVQAQRAPAQVNKRVELTLEQAVERALDHNLDIAVERLNPPLWDLEIAEVNASYRPTFTTDLSSASRTNPQTSQLDGAGRGPSEDFVLTDTSTIDAGVSQAVPWRGGSYEVNWNNSRTDTTNVFSSFNPGYRSAFLASYRQPLLRGFTTDSTRQQLQVTKINRQISDIDLRQTVTNTLADVRNAYWDLAYAVQAVGVQQQTLDLAEKLVQDNRARVEIGTMAPIDIVQSQAEAAARRESLAQAEQRLRTNELALKRLIVGGTGDEVWQAQIIPVDRPTFNPQPIDIEEAIRTAEAQHTNLARTRYQLDINNVNLGALRNETLPSLDVVGAFQLQGQGGDRFLRLGFGGPPVGVIPGGFGDAIDQIIDADFPVWSLQLQLSYPLGGSSADAQYARAKLQVQQTQAELRQMELQIASEVTNTALQVESIVKRIEAAAAARELAQRQLEAEQSKFEVGISTSFFVVQAQRDLATAQDTELRALLDYQKALIDFERAQKTSLSDAEITIISGGDGGG